MGKRSCPVCGGAKSSFRNPLSGEVSLPNRQQRCLTCGLRVEYWPVVERLREELRLAHGELTPSERHSQDFIDGTFDAQQDNA